MKVLVVFFVLIVAVLTERVRYDFHKVHRVFPQKESQIKMLRKLQKDPEYNFWTEPRRLYQSVDVMVPPDKTLEFTRLVQTFGLKDSIFVENVQELIDREQEVVCKDDDNMDWTKYHTLEEFYAWLDSLEKKYDFVKTVIVGKSYEKRDIKGIEITFGEGQRTVFFEAGIHAREWISPAATSFVVNEIIQSPPDSIFRTFNYIYIPSTNPDGYAYTWTTDRLWRKTRTPYECDNRTYYGADPNRNWNFHWDEEGADNLPSSENYAGPMAFSEIETKSLSDFLSRNAVPKKIDVYISFHSYSQLLMYPWGYTNESAPLKEIWQRIGEAAANDLKKVNNTDFIVGDVYSTIYPVSGDSLDWVYHNLNATITFVYELRDTGEYGFLLPPEYILPSGEELYASVKRIMVEYSKLPPKTQYGL